MQRFLLLPAAALLMGAVVTPFSVAQTMIWEGAPAATDAPGTAPAGAPAQATRPPTIFPINPQAGEWMICAASYAGPDALELARQLVLVLRDKHQLPAYIYNRSDELRRQADADRERILRLHPEADLRHRRTFRLPDQCAVLVGGYSSFEDAGAGVKAIRALPMPKLWLGDGKTPYDLMNLYEPDPQKRQTLVRRAPVSPYANALVVRNPTLPPAPRPADAPDPFWKELNADEPYSLLKCPARYTLVVKDYIGTTTIQPRTSTSAFLNMLGMGPNRLGTGLTAAGYQAHALADFLHQKLGYEAYVLHTRNKSIVSVGSFASLDDPNLMRIKQQLSALKFKRQGSNPRDPDPVGLFAQPLPMAVPRY